MKDGETVIDKPFEVPWITIIFVTGVLLFFVIQLDHLIVKNFEEPGESETVIEFVDRNVLVEVPVYGCPEDFNAVIQTSCVQFGGLVSPVTQESLDEIRLNGGVCEQQESGIVCQPCLRVEQIGWTCIDNQYLEAVQTG